MKLTLTLIAALFSFVSCTQRQEAVSPQAGLSPEDVVRQFVSLSSAAKEGPDKAKLQELCVGAMKKAFESMSDEVFRISYLSTNLKIREFKIVETVTRGESARVHYQVFVENPQGTDPTQEVNEREVELVRSSGAWFIETIRPKGRDQIAFTRGMIF